MTFSVEPVPCLTTPLGRFDPRWQLAGLVLAAGAVASLQTLPASASALAGSLALAGWSRLPPRWCLKRLAVVVPMLVFFAAFLPFLVHDPEAAGIAGPISFSPKGARLALLLCLKTFAIVMVILVLLASAPLQDLLRAAHCLRVPGVLVHLALLAYRYLFLLAGELGQLRVALRTRGYQKRLTAHGIRTVAHVVGTLLVRSHARSERVGQAMRSRGFDGRFRSLTAMRTRPIDVARFAVVVVAAAGLWLWDFLMRAGC